MNQLEMFRHALAAVQAKASIQPGEQFLIKNIDFWEEWTGHAEKYKKETNQIISDFFKEQFGEQFGNIKTKKEEYKEPTKEDSVPFDDDMKLFTDADFDNIINDEFETIQTNTHNLYGIIKSRLRSATRPDWHDQHEPDRLNDLRIREKRIDRMIIEDCMCSSTYNIEILQLTSPDANNIPAHLKIEDIKKFNPSIKNLPQAALMRDTLKSLDLDFTTWVTKPIVSKLENGGYKKASLSKRIRDWCKEDPNRLPWEAPVGTSMTALCDIALELNKLNLTEQEDIDPDWDIDENIAYNFTADWQQPEPEPVSEVVSTVGEYTYLKMSRIPDAKEFNKNKYHKIKHKDFYKLIESMDNMTGEELAGWYKEIVQSKTGTYEQKDRFDAEYARILSSRAEFKGEITICEPMLEPTESREEIHAELFGEQLPDWKLEIMQQEKEEQELLLTA